MPRDTVDERGAGRAVLWDGLLLAAGTLAAVPVPPPARVDRHRAAVAMVAAPLLGLLVGAAAVLAGTAALLLGLPVLVAAALALGADALLTRFLHLDGLADTADGLAAAAHGNRERALAVMRRGDVGPVGVSVLLLTLLASAGSLAAFWESGLPVNAAGWPPAADGTAPAHSAGAVLAGWVGSRAVLPLSCARGVRPARPDGLGATVVGAVPRWAAVLVGLATLAGGWLAAGQAGLLVVLAALAVGVLASGFSARRLGGLTGDTLGAAVQLALLAALATAAATAGW